MWMKGMWILEGRWRNVYSMYKKTIEILEYQNAYALNILKHKHPQDLSAFHGNPKKNPVFVGLAFSGHSLKNFQCFTWENLEILSLF